MLERILDIFPEEEFLVVDGFNDAVIGVENDSLKLIYSVEKCIEILKQNGSSENEAIDFICTHLSDSYLGDKTPIWCWDIY